MRIWLKWGLLIPVGWFLLMNSLYLIKESISIWHYLLSWLITGVTYLCYTQIIKCWELQLPSEAAEYYFDFLAMNVIVHVFDPIWHFVW